MPREPEVEEKQNRFKYQHLNYYFVVSLRLCCNVYEFLCARELVAERERKCSASVSIAVRVAESCVARGYSKLSESSVVV